MIIFFLKPIEYIFEAGKIPSPFPAGISSKEEFVRNQFLEMYKTNPGFFLTNNSLQFWRNATGNQSLINNQAGINELVDFLDDVSIDDNFLKFINLR